MHEDTLLLLRPKNADKCPVGVTATTIDTLLTIFWYVTPTLCGEPVAPSSTSVCSDRAEFRHLFEVAFYFPSPIRMNLRTYTRRHEHRVHLLVRTVVLLVLQHSAAAKARGPHVSIY